MGTPPRALLVPIKGVFAAWVLCRAKAGDATERGVELEDAPWPARLLCAEEVEVCASGALAEG